MQAWLPTAEHNANRPQKSKQAIRPDKAGDSNVRLNIFPLSQSLFYKVFTDQSGKCTYAHYMISGCKSLASCHLFPFGYTNCRACTNPHWFECSIHIKTNVIEYVPVLSMPLCRRCWIWRGVLVESCWRILSHCCSKTATTTCACPSTTFLTLTGEANCWPSIRWDTQNVTHWCVLCLQMWMFVPVL